MSEPSKKSECICIPYKPPRCSICGGPLYGTLEMHSWTCPRAARAIEEDKDKERV